MTVKAYDKDIHFNMVDVAVDSIALPSLVRVMIKYSKADGGRKKGNQIYPVGALMAYFLSYAEVVKMGHSSGLRMDIS